MTKASEQLLEMLGELREPSVLMLKRFVVLMYSRTDDIVEVSEARRQLFSQKYWSLEHIPPTRPALEQHVKSTAYQANI